MGPRSSAAGLKSEAFWAAKERALYSVVRRRLQSGALKGVVRIIVLAVRQQQRLILIRISSSLLPLLFANRDDLTSASNSRRAARAAWQIGWIHG